MSFSTYEETNASVKTWEKRWNCSPSSVMNTQSKCCTILHKKFSHNYLLEIFRSFWFISLHTKQTIQSKICLLITLQLIISHHLCIKWVITTPDERELQRDIDLQLSFKLKYRCPPRQKNMIKFLLPLKNNIFNL